MSQKKFTLFYTNEFKKEIKLSKKRNKDLEKLFKVIELLENGKELPAKYNNHKLKGTYKDRWELHIEPNWLLIYKKDGDSLILERTGSHSDLFE